ncbi:MULTISPECIES: 2OG-Fe dioxygenase family protein [unclassified Acinetobacter]|uniref:2OG-Fe dioxygenase family protein n=1 Tax=unclassified Acinetobacter TaxID=196816 RepID=UPI0035BA7A8E
MNALAIQGTLPSELIHTLDSDFDTLQPNIYKDGSYRLRRYSTFTYQREHKKLMLNPHRLFVQSDTLNHFQGNVARDYEDLTQACIESEAFKKIIDTFATASNLPEQAIIEVHQLRMLSKHKNDVIPTAPEGIHQDGFDRIGMFIVKRHNAQGGDLQVYTSCNKDNLMWRVDSQTGAYCVLDDSYYWHDATELAALNDDMGYWDLFVLTAHLKQ